MNRILLTLATLALVTTLFGGAAIAHAKFQSSTPAPGQTVANAPANVTITFTEELAAGSTGTVVSAAGATVSTAATISTTNRKILSIALRPGLPSGTYTVRWHSISADDGDPLDGTFTFGVGIPAPSTATLPGGDSTGFALLLLAIAVALGAVSTRALRHAKA